MDDLIYRQAAINEVMRVGKAVTTFAIRAKNALNELPTAEPERKKGKWIPHSEISWEYKGTALVSVWYDYWFCDICGYRVENGQPMYNFCPFCGADMRGEEDE